MLLLNPKTTLDEAAEKLKLSKRTMSRTFASLQEKEYIRRNGTNKNGYWEVLK